MSDQFIPPWQDMATLCRNTCLSPTTVDNWVARGILPPPRKRGGKLMWKWVEVDKLLTDGRPGVAVDPEAEAIRENTRREAESAASH